MTPPKSPHPDHESIGTVKGKILADIQGALQDVKIRLGLTPREGPSGRTTLDIAYQQLKRGIDHAGEWMETSDLGDVRDRLNIAKAKLDEQYRQISDQLNELTTETFRVINKNQHARGYVLHRIEPIPNSKQGISEQNHRSDPAADVIFVHGLGGNAFDTWYYNPDLPFESWPFWLAAELRHVKVWSLGYPAAPNSRRGQGLALPTIAQGAINTLNGQVGGRPLIFVAHSLGGLVVKKIIEMCHKSPSGEFGFIDDYVRGIVFLATPHDGSYFATLAYLARLFYRSSVTVEDLRKNNAGIDALGSWFSDYAHQRQPEPDRKVYVNAHRETAKIKILKVFELFVVEPGSAKPGVAHAKLFDAVGKDHFTISKCRSRDEEEVYRETKRMILTLAPRTEPARPREPPRAT
jgi:pimeloyl-ACP methyl ester carboxylesterase